MASTRIALTAGIVALGAGALTIPALTTPADAQAAGGNAAAGRTVFARCAACHAVTPGTKRIGPSLHGVVGRKAGASPGFAYSPAMKNSNVTWNAAALDRFLTRPSANMPGNKMVFVGLPNPTDRANLVAYLNTLR